METTLKRVNRTSTRRVRVLLGSWLKQRAMGNKAAVFLVICALISGFLTYSALNALPPFEDNPNAILWMLNIDFIIVILFAILIIRQISLIWASRKKGVAGAKLHIRLIYIFSLIAGIPAIAMTLFSAFFFLYNIHGWFSEKVESAINESQAVAQAYLEEHQQTIKADIMAMAADLNRQSELLGSTEDAMSKMLETQSFLRNFSEAVLLNKNGKVLLQAGLSMNTPSDMISDDMIKRVDAMDGKNILILKQEGMEDKLRALVKLVNYDNTYLYVSRYVDAKVLKHLEATRKGAKEYQALRGSSTKIQIMITSIYLVIALLIMISAIWFALNLARRIVEPIGKLISATEAVRSGNLSARAYTGQTGDEFETLGKAFNRMTEQLQIQQDELVEANRMLDYRRRFTETILGGVSTGVISIDSHFDVSLINSAGIELLRLERSDLIGRHIASILPESFYMVETAFANPMQEITHNVIEFRRSDGAHRYLRLSVSVELVGENETGAIITFDDITDIQIAQKRSAWADVARRIAHEIKNPLTPIQLSTERLRRKYLKTLTDKKDKEIFSQCTETIIKHVEDIKNMVNSFSDFAKMPDPVFEETNFSKLIADCFGMQKQANPDIIFTKHDDENILSSDNPVILSIDEQQIRQSITNLIQNAVDALGDTVNEKKIGLFVKKDAYFISVGVADSGEGIPPDIINHITDPYVTNKKKGTGLGLAIVKKIIEDHGGELHFSNDADDIVFAGTEDIYSGAYISFRLPLHKIKS